MSARGYPDKRIDRLLEYGQRSIRMRREEGRRRAPTAAERNFCRDTRVSLCGTVTCVWEKKEIKKKRR